MVSLLSFSHPPLPPCLATYSYSLADSLTLTNSNIWPEVKVKIKEIQDAKFEILICSGTLLLHQAAIHSLEIINKIVGKRQGLLSSWKRLNSKLSLSFRCYILSKVRRGIHRLLSETDSGDQTEEGGGETEEGEQETERRVVSGGYTADGEEVEEEEEEEESGSIDLEQEQQGGPVSETAMGCVSREAEEGGGGGGTDSGIDRTTVGSSRVGSAEGWLARLSSRLVILKSLDIQYTLH